MKYECEFRDIPTSQVQDAVQGRAVMNMVTSLWGLLCSEVTSPLNKDSAAMVWFNCAAIELRGGSNPDRNERFFSSRRPDWLWHPFSLLVCGVGEGEGGEQCFV